jgi:N-acetylglucosaminyldiphosphoundecaprenol N-acetyl-beta-D-mannosaminyltransferase
MKKTSFSDSNTARKYVNILGLSLNSTSERGVLATVEDFLVKNVKFTVFTPNPEIVLMARKDRVLKKAINSADLTVPDGIGLKYAAKFLFGKPLTIIPGRKLFKSLVKKASEKGWKIFLLGGLNDEAEIASSKLQMTNTTAKRVTQLQIRSFSGPKLDRNANPVTERDVKIEIEAIEKINRFKPDILFVGFGAPKQEKWIHKWLSKLNVGGAMAVGGTFSYLADYSKLPPAWMERAGLEWLWRLLKEPGRIKRIVSAVVIFPLKVLCSKFWQKRA